MCYKQNINLKYIFILKKKKKKKKKKKIKIYLLKFRCELNDLVLKGYLRYKTILCHKVALDV